VNGFVRGFTGTCGCLAALAATVGAAVVFLLLVLPVLLAQPR